MYFSVFSYSFRKMLFNKYLDKNKVDMGTLVT